MNKHGIKSCRRTWQIPLTRSASHTTERTGLVYGGSKDPGLRAGHTHLPIAETVWQHAGKSQRANRHIWFFADPHPNAKKPKEPIFLPSLERTNKETNEMYIEKRDKQKI